MLGNTEAGILDPYLPRILLRRIRDGDAATIHSVDGTVVFVDISGFTNLSERLARRGSEGAEHLTYAVNACFSALLTDAWDLDGSLLKFGGDALLVWFEGDDHPARACCAAATMRSTLRRVSMQEGLRLRMSVGVHSGMYDTFLLGSSHRECLIAGPSISRVVAMEASAGAGQILLSPETAARLPPSASGAACGEGVLLARAPRPAHPPPQPPLEGLPPEVLAQHISTALRAHLTAGPGAPEHRTVTLAFLQFGGIDRLIAGSGGEAAAEAMQQLVSCVQDAADRFEICFLGSDVCADGGKLILTAGAPRVLGDDEERLLLAMRSVLDTPLPIPVRVGVNRGRVFAGEIGPTYRRTYTVMGDTVNLAARLMAQAPWGAMYATKSVLESAGGKFEATELEPFMVKGKQRPVTALAIGRAQRAAPLARQRTRLPLIGRERELELITSTLEDARRGRGGLVELVGDVGSGKSRLLTEARRIGADLRSIHLTCQSYTQATAYASARDLLRQLLDLPWDASADAVRERLETEVAGVDPGLAPWLPLVGSAIDVPLPPSVEVQQLSEGSRQSKMHEVTTRLLSQQMVRPTLVQIEHGQFMDEASAGLIGHLAGRLGDSAWALVVTRRAVDAGFAAPPGAARLELGPLDPEAMMRIAEATPAAELVPPHVLRTAVERADGSPEFMLDLLAAAAGGSSVLPDDVEGAAAARLDALDPGDRALVRRAAVLGVSFRPEQLADLLEPGHPQPGLEVWTRLEGVFAFEADGYVRFKRPLLRDVAYHGLPFSLRRQLHARVARRLERERAQLDPAVLSLHFLLAGDMNSAWVYARLGAEQDAARFAHADAVRLWRRAIEAGKGMGVGNPELAAVWEALARSLMSAGEMNAAGEAVQAARRLVGDDPLTEGRLLYLQTRVAEHSASLTTAVRWGSRGLRKLEALEGSKAVVWRARTLARLAFYRSRQGRLAEAERLCRRAIGEAATVGEQEAQAYAHWVLDWVLFEAGRHEEMGYSEQALDIYSRLGDLEEVGNVLNNLAVFAFFRWRWDEALKLFREAASSREHAGVYGGVAASEVNIGEIMLDRGDYEQAALHLNRARRLWRATGDRAATAYAGVMLGRLEVRAGNAESGLSKLRDGIDELRRLGEHGYVGFAEALLAEGEAYGGDPAIALSLARRLVPSGGRMLPLLHRVSAIALARLETPGARAEVERALAIARERDALYDVAATLDLLSYLAVEDAATMRERDRILVRLGIECLPVPPLPGSEGRLAVSALG